MILFKAEAIHASSTSKFGRDDFKSSTESTISTSLIHNMASEGELEQTLTWVVHLIFQHENVEGVENLSN